MRISDWSSDVCSSDLPHALRPAHAHRRRDRGAGPAHPRTVRAVAQPHRLHDAEVLAVRRPDRAREPRIPRRRAGRAEGHSAQAHRRPGRAIPLRRRSEEHTSELQSLMRNSYAVFCLTKKNQKTNTNTTSTHHIETDTKLT